MGRYKRGGKYHHRGQNRTTTRKTENSGRGDDDGDNYNDGSLVAMVMMSDSDWTLLEK
jgi:hypothetical protein